MSYWYDPSGHSTFGIGLCARCPGKFSLDDLFDDPNHPGLKVCVDCMDQLDPYRLPPREADPITLPFTRPDIPIPASAVPPVVPGDPGWPPADAVTTTGTDTVTGT